MKTKSLKRLLSIGFLIILLCGCDVATTMFKPGSAEIAELPGWELAWHDEFDGRAVDTDNWNYDIGGWGWGNGEAQYYTSRKENGPQRSSS